MVRVFAIGLGKQVEELDRGRERNREINVATRDMEFESVGDQGDADQYQKGERQHLGGGMLADEFRARSRRYIHEETGDHDRSDHDLQILRHADRGDDGIEREDEINDNDLDDYPE